MKNNITELVFILDRSGSMSGLEGDTIVDVINLKCSPDDAPALCMTDGIFPAYHMNKKHWVSVVYSMVPAPLSAADTGTDSSSDTNNTKGINFLCIR